MRGRRGLIWFLSEPHIPKIFNWLARNPLMPLEFFKRRTIFSRKLHDSKGIRNSVIRVRCVSAPTATGKKHIADEIYSIYIYFFRNGNFSLSIYGHRFGGYTDSICPSNCSPTKGNQERQNKRTGSGYLSSRSVGVPVIVRVCVCGPMLRDPKANKIRIYFDSGLPESVYESTVQS